jgi:hypothetical protein
VFSDEKHLILIGRAIDYLKNTFSTEPDRPDGNLLKEYISNYDPGKINQITP